MKWVKELGIENVELDEQDYNTHEELAAYYPKFLSEQIKKLQIHKTCRAAYNYIKKRLNSLELGLFSYFIFFHLSLCKLKRADLRRTASLVTLSETLHPGRN
jgi:hypothetical protein